MKKLLLVLALIAPFAGAYAQPILRSGWTTSSVPATARTALGVLSATEVTNRFAAISGTILHNGLTVTGNISGTTFSGDGSALTGIGMGSSNVSDTGYTFVTRSNLQVDGVITSLTNTSMLFLSRSGNDATAKRGHPDKPWATWAAVLTNAVAGDTIYAGNGVWDVSATATAGCSTNGTTTPVEVAKGGVLVTNKNNLTILGSGQTVISNGIWGHHMNLANCSNITIRNIKFMGRKMAMPTNVWNQSITIAALQMQFTNTGHIIADCIFDQIQNHGVSSLYIAEDARWITIERCKFYNCGISTNGLINDRIDGSMISGIGSFWVIRDNFGEACVRGIELQGGGNEAPVYRMHSNIVISGNTIVSNNSEAILIQGYYHNVQIVNNKIYQNYATYTNDAVGVLTAPRGIDVDNGTNIVINNNMINGVKCLVGANVTAVGILVRNGAHIQICNNHIQDCGYLNTSSSGVGVYVISDTGWAMHDVLIQGNVIHDMLYRGNGIVTGGAGQDVSDVAIIGNQVYDISSGGYTNGPTYCPIFLEVGSNLTVYANRAYDSRWPNSSKQALHALNIGPYVTNAFIAANNFSGMKVRGITNQGENITFLADTNQFYW